MCDKEGKKPKSLQFGHVHNKRFNFDIAHGMLNETELNKYYLSRTVEKRFKNDQGEL